MVSDKETGLVPAVQAAFKDYPEKGKTIRYQFCQLHYLKRCEAGMEEDLKELGEAVRVVESEIREVQRELASEGKDEGNAKEEAIREAARDLATAARAAANVSGRPVSDPPAPKRAQRLLGVEKACRKVLKKGVQSQSAA